MATVYDGFLVKWTAELAWFVGCFLGNGCAWQRDGTYKVGIIANPEHAERWVRLASPDAKVYEIKHCPSMRQAWIYSKPFFEELSRRFGYDGPKAASIEWPSTLPSELYPPFIRGLLDTDGTINISDRPEGKGRPALRVSFSSISKSIVHHLAEVVSYALKDRVNVGSYAEKTGTTTYKVNWNGKKAIPFLHYIYKDAPEHLRNEVRYAKYLEACAMMEERAKATCECGKPVTKLGMCEDCYWSKKYKPKVGMHLTCTQCGAQGVKGNGLCAKCYRRSKYLLEKAAKAAKDAVQSTVGQTQ